jgi:hypothetical protein
LARFLSKCFFCYMYFCTPVFTSQKGGFFLAASKSGLIIWQRVTWKLKVLFDKTEAQTIMSRFIGL